jgi:CMP/dCMP kinase
VSGRVIALGGPPGSGKSTAGRLAAQRLGREFVSAGERFRAEAARRGLTLEALGALAENEASVDRSLDEAMLALASPDRLLDGRVVGALCRQRGIPVDYLWVTARPEVRIARLCARDHVEPSACRAATERREASERRRYLAWYGIDLEKERPDLTIDSSALTAEVVAETIGAFVTRSGGPP